MADGLFEQLRGIGETGLAIPIISSHDLSAMVREVQRGKITGAEATAALGLTAETVTEITALIAEVNLGNLAVLEVTDVFDLVQSGKHWTVKAMVKTRLGI